MNAIADPFGANVELIQAIRNEIAAEYAEPHDYPWIIGFSGGKDSTVVAHLVFEHLLTLAPSARKRPVYVVSNDTRVESPLVIAHVRTIMDEIQAAAHAFALPVKVQITQPDEDHTFWVSRDAFAGNVPLNTPLPMHTPRP
jgi:DNA sulfur modification protein DndC